MADHDSRKPTKDLPDPHDPSIVATQTAGGPPGAGTLVGEGPAIVPGQVLDGKYRIDDKIAEGGMGAVWRATHLHLDAPIAVKVLTPELREQPQAIERFWHEARMMGGLGHPNIVRVLDVSSPVAPLPYIVMELLPGESLRARMSRKGRLELADACAVLDGVLTALIVAHRQGIVHRDLKPENIFLVPRADDDQGPAFYVKVLDFGASKLVDEERDPHLTRAGGFLGTPMYMAPEQAGGGSITHRCDLYSAGVVLYEMVSGKLPHYAANLQALLFQLATADATPITNHMPGVHPLVHEFLTIALAREPSQRFDTAEAMRRALRKLPGASGDATQALGSTVADVYQAALDRVEESSDGVDMFPTLSPVEPAVQALRSSQAGASAMPDLVGPNAIGPGADPPLELDLPGRAEAEAQAGRRAKWPILAILVLAGAPAYLAWSLRSDALVQPLQAEMAGVIADPRGVREGRLRPPRDIEPELERAEATAMRDAGITWGAASVLGLAVWWIAGRRR